MVIDVNVKYYINTPYKVVKLGKNEKWINSRITPD